MMQIKVVDHAPNKRLLLLCDAEGVPLPNQAAVSLKQEVGEPTTVTVTFVVDGRKIGLGR